LGSKKDSKGRLEGKSKKSAAITLATLGNRRACLKRYFYKKALLNEGY